ncbi:MAG: hypothetical protein MZV63_25495 [Marinilabiliales bacterium]|nr:hypothetical protein [Marinilabiliales bacterium]
MRRTGHWCVKNAARFGISAGPGKEMNNASDGTAQLAVQGPLALSGYAKAYMQRMLLTWSIIPSRY